MRRAVTILVLVTLVLVPAQVMGAERKRVQWLTSIYAGPKGLGLKYPEAVACRGNELVVADTGNSRLVRYTYERETVAATASLPLGKAAPIVVQINSEGALYFLDGAERRIAAVSATGEQLGALALRGLRSSAEVVPKSFRIDRDDNIYILDIFSARVLVLDPAGRYLRHVSFPEDYGFFSDLAVDRQGRIFLVDSVDAVVYATTGSGGFSALTGSLKDYVNFPTALTLDNRGMVYLVDQHGSGLAVVGSDGSFLGRRLGMGWNESGLYFPSHMCISENGVAFIADRNNSRVQVFSLGWD